MSGAFLAVEVLLGVAFGAVGVHDAGEVAPDAVEVGGVHPARFLEQDLFAAAAGVWRQREPLDRLDDHGCLVGRHRARMECVEGRGPFPDEQLGVLDGPFAVAAGGAGQVGEPVSGRPPGQLLLREVAGVDLGQQLGLQRGGLGLELLQLLDACDQLIVGPRGPQ